jgi:ATP-dependent DNA helicase RecG
MALNDQELEKLLRAGESDRVERKSSLSDKEKVCQAICAFANDLANHGETGVIFIGAHDDGSPAGLPITDKLLQELADLRSNGNIYPFPLLRVEERKLLGASMAVVFVDPSEAPPVRFKGRTWIRVGPRRDIATREEERRLSEKRRGKDLPFELLPVDGAKLEDLDVDLFLRSYLPQAVAREVMEENDRTLEQKLTSLRFLDSKSGLPTRLGVLSVGVEPRAFIPGAYIQFVRFAGNELTDPIKDQAELDGALPFMLKAIDEKLQAHNSISTTIDEADLEIQKPEYPLPALQQIVRNAVLHRTYESSNAPVRLYWFADRVEVHSPGGPFGAVNSVNFGEPGVTDYRNAYLAEVMKNLGYVQRFGVGIQLARKQLSQNGNPPPEFGITQEFIVTTIRRGS